MPEMCASADVVLTTAKVYTLTLAEQLLGLREKHGFLLVVDHDDPVWMYTPQNRPMARRLLNEADLVVVASERMRDECEGNPKQIVVIPNVANPRLFLPLEPRGDKSTTVVFMGSASHTEDYDSIREAIERLAKERPDLKHLNINAAPGWACDMNIHRRQQPSYLEHLRFLNSLRPAVAVVPLKKEYRTHLTTHTKYLDYTVCGIPGVYQGDHGAYDVVQDDITGLRATTTGQWLNSVIRLADDVGLADSIVSEARKDVFARFSTKTYLGTYLEAISVAMGTKMVANG
jgi:glycosyltransferase involved in cell wall biosynthesis